MELGLVCANALSVVAYGFFPGFRLGRELLGGTCTWALSFTLLLMASILMYGLRSKELSADEGKFACQLP